MAGHARAATTLARLSRPRWKRAQGGEAPRAVCSSAGVVTWPPPVGQPHALLSVLRRNPDILEIQQGARQHTRDAPLQW
jgi:hypothetical protein